MPSAIDDNRTEILTEAKVKRARALRFARAGNPREEEYWLGVAGRMTEWIEHLERRDFLRDMPPRQAPGPIEVPPGNAHGEAAVPAGLSGWPPYL